MFREPVFEKIKLPAVAALLALLLCFRAYAAAELPDEAERGSICVTLTSEDTGEPIHGGSITLYKAGDVVHDENWNYSFKLTDEFSGSDCSLDEPDKRNAQIAGALARYAAENDLKGIVTLTVDSEGKAVFTDLGIGLYLLVQTTASEGYYPVNPFIVSLPFYDESAQAYQYLNIDAFPKTEPARKEIPAETSPHPNSGGGSGSGSGSHSEGISSGGPGVSDGSSEQGPDIWPLFPLPQTGQGRALFFGFMALAVSAAALIIVLWLRRRKETLPGGERG